MSKRQAQKKRKQGKQAVLYKDTQNICITSKQAAF